MRQSRGPRTAVACAAAVATLLATAPAVAAPTPTPGAPAGSAPKASVTWSIAPAGAQGGPDGRSAFAYEGDPGQVLKDTVAVTNFSSGPVTLKVYASDAVNTPTGGFDLLAADKKPNDVGAWIALAQRDVTIPAKATLNVPFTLTIPANGTPGDHVGGIVATLTQGGGQVVVENRIGTRIYLRVRGKLVPSLAVTKLDAAYHDSWNPFSGGAVTVAYTVRNTGNIRLAAGQVVDVTGATGGRLAGAQPPGVAELLPGQSLSYTVTVEGVAPFGPLNAKVVVAPTAVKGDKYTESLSAATLGTGQRSADLFAVPWSLLLTLLLLTAAVWLAIVELRRRRRNTARALTEAVEQARLEERRAATGRANAAHVTAADATAAAERVEETL
ncbi:WxL protein peptidoglycan domain-containing protein [Dactylosporangium siamense]|uniref:DUF7507 domain-containing protein n=1 Tax=Dactylosporangium siamense TaxID=685454 RepID=A0A919PXE0_9ACTN|nr:DUF916 domain-containing protein [Dactylosporangium siamense]GIG52156.1 hypothetical protein Dsi01nite_101970 [Dactylosporangium siamense]